MLGKASTIKRFEYSSLGSELRKETGIAKDQYKFFKGQINVVNNKREDDVKAEDGEIIHNVRHRYFGDEYKNLIANIFKCGLMDGHLHVTNFDNRHLALTNTVNAYLEKHVLVWIIVCLISRNPLKPKQRPNMTIKKEFLAS